MRAVNAVQPGRARRQVQHVAPAQQRFRAVGVQNGARIHLAGHAKGNARREVGLDQAGDDVHRWPLRRQNQVNAHGARHLRQARDGFLDVVRIHHHQIGQLIDHDDDLGQRLVLLLLDILEQRERLALGEGAIVLVDVAHAALREQLEPPFHLSRGVAQHV